MLYSIIELICRTHMLYSIIELICRTHMLYSIIELICRTHMLYSIIELISRTHMLYSIIELISRTHMLYSIIELISRTHMLYSIIELISRTHMLYSIIELISRTHMLYNIIELGELQLLNSGTKAGCATYLMLRCSHCGVSKSFWSVSGRFGSHNEVESGKQVSKRNATVYASVLGGRLIGVGCESLSLYHACLGIPSCPAGSTFSEVEVDILTAAETLANK